MNIHQAVNEYRYTGGEIIWLLIFLSMFFFGAGLTITGFAGILGMYQ